MISALKMAFRNIFYNKMRSFLTMLGIIIGVMAVVMLMSIGQSASSSITGSISSLGANLISIRITDEDVTVTEEELEEYLGNLPIIGIAPVLSTTVTMKVSTSTKNQSITGVSVNYKEVYDTDVQSGRWFMQADVDFRTPVCIMGTEVAGSLFESYDIIGKTVNLNDTVFTVIGLLKDSGTSISGSGNNTILVPLTTAERLAGETDISTYYVAAKTEDDVSSVKSVAEMALYLLTEDEDAYTVYNQSSVLDTMSEVTSTVAIMLGGIAGISLLVGGIGIMNIMLVTVTERTREIGIRKAIGAKKRIILFQFLVEACVLSLFGGLIGVGISMLGLEVYSLIASTTVTMYWNYAGLALGFCVVIGMLFGIYPANKAAKLQPIEALRYS